MEFYPGELLVGVFPLVFCVDATLERKGEVPTSPTNSSRSQFDKFLDTIAASSSMVDGDDIHDGGPLMQRVEEEQSDNEDEMLLNGGGRDSSEIHFLSPNRRRSSTSRTDGSSSSVPGTPKDGSSRKLRFSGTSSPFSKKMDFRRMSKRKSSKRSAGGRSAENGGIKVSTALAEALQQGQSFFQRARIVSTSTRHGFPPSKDPEGQSNRVIGLTGLRPGQQPAQRESQKKMIARLEAVTAKRPIDGILPSGWLEKHAAALPSVIVVVAQVYSAQHDIQQKQDNLLVEALENLQYSLAPKRKVDVKVVALVQEGVSPIRADQWSQEILGRLPAFLHHNNANKIDHETVVTLVHAKELRSDDKDDITSPAAVSVDSTSTLPRLHRSIRKSSLRYYRDRSREVKEKLLRLGGPHAATDSSPLLLPLAIRYCFKAAVFYEFRWKEHKSLKYMVEAYRLVEIYYRYLLMLQHHGGESQGGDDPFSDHNNSLVDDSVDVPSLPDISTLETSNNVEGVFDAGEGVEMSLPSTASSASSRTSYSDEYYTANPPKVAEDMVYQCRAVADWLNFKILQMCLTSHEKSGMVAASAQWQRHSRGFCCPRRSFLHTIAAPWLDWSYVSQQLMAASQLLERYPPRSLGLLGAGDFDEDLLRCSPWRTYEAAADALMKAGHRIQLVKNQGGPSSVSLPAANDGDLRLRYVGGIDHEGFRPSFEEESKKNYTERALQCALRGIALYEKEVEQLGKAKALIPWSRSGAHLFHLAGGALVGLNRHSEAIPHLEKAVGFCKGWGHLESLARQLLITCYEKQGGDGIGSPENCDIESRRSRTSFLLDSYFNATFPVDELSSALVKLAKMKGVETVDSCDGTCIRWDSVCIDNATGDATFKPFKFALTFPDSTHATAGETIKANIWIKSNLRYSICIDRFMALSFLGPLPIPPKYFPSTDKNTSSQKNGTILLQPGEAVDFDAEILLPMDPSPNEVDETNVSGASSDTKAVNPKPRTCGFTSSGGTRFVLEQENKSKSPISTSLSHQCIGGKPLLCEGIVVAFSPVGSSQGKIPLIESTILLKGPKPQPNTKHTFDENNYLSSAWKRPVGLHMNRGPRCLRLLPPTANMTVTNLTNDYTNGQALEGTVNRVVLELKAGENQCCKEVMVRVKCSHTLITSDGKKKQISTGGNEADTNTEGKVDMTNHFVRTPVLVKPDGLSKNLNTDFGYELPGGWTLLGDGLSGGDNYTVVASSVKAGESTYAYFDVYRPTSNPITVNEKDSDERMDCNDCNCETNFNVSIRYRQDGSQNDDVMPENNADNGFVSLDHNATVVWRKPMSITFSSTAQNAYPCGIQHPSNIISESASPQKSNLRLPINDTILIDRERVLTKGVIRAAAADNGLFVEVNKVEFIDAGIVDEPCKFKLLSGQTGDNAIYKTAIDNPCAILSSGSGISFAWMAEANMEDKYREQSILSPVGSIVVHWQPSPIELSKEVEFMVGNEFARCHGPLKLQRPSTCKFHGPLCYIESAPFSAKLEPLPDMINVAAPFEVTYVIKNNTPIEQGLEISLDDASSRGDESTGSFLISGTVNRSTSIGPYETHSLSYTAVPMKVGNVDLPSISMSSTRYRTWIIREPVQGRSIFVAP